MTTTYDRGSGVSLGRRRCGHPAGFFAEPLEGRRLLSAGDLDPSFDGDGRATATFPDGVIGFARAVAVQGDGKTVVVGGSTNNRFSVVRYNVDGSLDTTFGPDFTGMVLTSLGHGNEANAVAIQADGKIVVAGGTDGAGGPSGMDVVRYHPDGTLDRSFGGDGTVDYDFGFYADNPVPRKIVLLRPRTGEDSERILVGGSVSSGGPFTERDGDFYVTRLKTDGSLDESFGDDGTSIIGLGAEEDLFDMGVDYNLSDEASPYGRIVAVGTKSDLDGTFAEVAVIRLTSGGAPDRSFDGDGNAQLPLRPGVKTFGRALVIQPGSNYVVGGTAGNDFMMARFSITGPLDTTFGTAGTGWVTTDLGGIERGSDLMRSYEGGLILGGSSVTGQVGQPTTESTAFAAYTADGRTDARFTGGGKWTAGRGGGGQFGEGPGRRFVFAGGGAMEAKRFLDVGANLVRAASLDAVATEYNPDPANRNTASFFVYRSERLPYFTRVYYQTGGTAQPSIPRWPDRDDDYTGLPRGYDGGGLPWVDILANETYAVVTVAAIDDASPEGNEVAIFSLQPDAAYELGAPSVVQITIVDDDAATPSIAAVYVRGSTWRGPNADPADVTFKELLEARGWGDDVFGFRVDTLPAGTTLPWSTANQVVLRYTSPPTGAGIPSAGGVVLDGIRSDYSVTAVTQLDPQTFALTLDRALGSRPGGGGEGDRVSLRVAGGGPGGTAYALVLNPLQGDADRIGGRVNALDLGAIKQRLNRGSGDTTSGPGSYSVFADVTGDGRINALDFVAVKQRLNTQLPPLTAAAVAASAGRAPATPLRPASTIEDLLAAAPTTW